MKRLLFLTFLCLLVSSSVAQLFPYPYVTAPKGLRLRNAPSVQNGKIIDIIPPFAVVEVLKRGDEELIQGLKGNWVEVFWNGKKGWTFDAYMNYTVNEPQSTRNNNSYYLKRNPGLRIGGLPIPDLSQQALTRKWGTPIQEYIEGFREDKSGLGVKRVFAYEGIKFVFVKDMLDHIEINSNKRGLDNLFANGISKIDLSKYLKGTMDASYYMASDIHVALQQDYRTELNFSADNVLRRIILRVEN